MTTSAASITKSSPDPSKNGGPLQPLEQAVAVLETPTELECSRQTIIVLTAILHGLFYNTLSGDVMMLSMLSARETARKAGVPETEFNQIGKIVFEEWKRTRNRNPLSGMF
jgi:hypothetical protein